MADKRIIPLTDQKYQSILQVLAQHQKGLNFWQLHEELRKLHLPYATRTIRHYLAKLHDTGHIGTTVDLYDGRKIIYYYKGGCSS